ncbi:MAG: hypothetical protein DLM67_14870 [Candidatus Nephthysia bennettiae]|nr:MAG: hypothetical protein DLM67_14870 [Candidatus Dormibacteraeota bacterium]
MTAALACMTAWCVGLLGAEMLLPGQSVAGAVALAAAGVAVLFSVAVRPAVIGLALASALLGVVRAELTGGDPQLAARAAALAGSQALVSGRVADDPRPLSGGYEVLLEPDSIITPAGRLAPAGDVMVHSKAAAVVPAPGDRVQAAGRLELPRNRPGYDRRAYLAQRGAYLEMPSGQVSVLRADAGARALPGWLRDHYRKALEQLLPQPHAALLVGVVLGVRTGLPARLNQDLISTGLVHLLVLSGLKVAVFARLVKAALTPLLGRAATLPALALIALYALTGGATPAGVRAAAMGGVALAASHLGRPTHVWSSLAATGAGMLGWRPELAWDVGFQLSFVGTAAIILLTPSVEHRLPWLPAWLREPFAVTCAAQIGTVPFMARASTCSRQWPPWPTLRSCRCCRCWSRPGCSWPHSRSCPRSARRRPFRSQRCWPTSSRSPACWLACRAPPCRSPTSRPGPGSGTTQPLPRPSWPPGPAAPPVGRRSSPA